MRVLTVIAGLLLLGMGLAPAGASPEMELEKAAKQKQIVFLLVNHSQPPAIGIDAMRAMVRQVAPAPLVLVLGRNGLIAGGIAAAQATPERMLALVPMPKKEEVLRALDEKKVVFVEASRKGMTTRDAAQAACSAACSQLAGKSAMITIDMDDEAEKGFLTQMGIDPVASEPVTVVVNAAGQVTGNYQGVTTAGELVAAAQRRSGCCPAGSGSSCAPPK